MGITASILGSAMGTRRFDLQRKKHESAAGSAGEATSGDLEVTSGNPEVTSGDLWSSLGHGERQAVVRHLDLVLGLQVGHPLGADAVDGHDDVALDQVPLRRLAARRDLSQQTEPGQNTENGSAPRQITAGVPRNNQWNENRSIYHPFTQITVIWGQIISLGDRTRSEWAERGEPDQNLPGEHDLSEVTFNLQHDVIMWKPPEPFRTSLTLQNLVTPAQLLVRLAAGLIRTRSWSLRGSCSLSPNNAGPVRRRCGPVPQEPL